MRDILKEKHPIGQPPRPDTLLPEDPQTITDPPPSSVRAAEWWVEVTLHFLPVSIFRPLQCPKLPLVQVARCLCCTENVNHEGLTAFVACRLIPLDKQLGVRPIDVCEVSRRIISKVILDTISSDVQQAAGTLQLCAGQPAGIEAAIHAMCQLQYTMMTTQKQHYLSTSRPTSGCSVLPWLMSLETHKLYKVEN